MRSHAPVEGEAEDGMNIPKHARDKKCPYCGYGAYRTVRTEAFHYIVECLNRACNKTFLILRPAA